MLDHNGSTGKLDVFSTMSNGWSSAESWRRITKMSTDSNQEVTMIARTWYARATAEKADDYSSHFTTDVVQNLKRIPGSMGAYLLRRDVDGEVEFVAVTLWDSIDTIKKFSGDNPEVSHVEPEGQAALRDFDKFARNYEIVCDTVDVGQAAD